MVIGADAIERIRFYRSGSRALMLTVLGIGNAIYAAAEGVWCYYDPAIIVNGGGGAININDLPKPQS